MNPINLKLKLNFPPTVPDPTIGINTPYGLCPLCGERLVFNPKNHLIECVTKPQCGYWREYTEQDDQNVSDILMQEVAKRIEYDHKREEMYDAEFWPGENYWEDKDFMTDAQLARNALERIDERRG